MSTTVYPQKSETAPRYSQETEELNSSQCTMTMVNMVLTICVLVWKLFSETKEETVANN